jgi:hypothetical protein
MHHAATRSLHSLLALSVTTSLALAGGDDEKKPNPYQSGGISWKPGQGIVFADTDEFGMRMFGQIQAQYAYTANENAADTNNFLVRRARIAWGGHAFSRDIQYLLRLDSVDDGTGANGAVKDAFVHWTFAKAEASSVGVRVGQAKAFHGLESTSPAVGLFFVEKASTTRAFSDVRSRGAWLHGSHEKNALRWVVGAQNGDIANGATGITERGEEASNADNELSFVANGWFDPFGDMTGGKGFEAWRQGDLGDIEEPKGSIGGGAMFSNNRSAAVANTDIESTSFNVNTTWAFGSGFTAMAEVYLREDSPQGGISEDSTGWYAQGTWTAKKSEGSDMQWGFGVRVNSIETDDTNTFMTFAGLGTTPGEVMEYTAVANAFYHGHACKTQFEYTLQDVDPDAGVGSTNHIVRIQFQLLF